LHPFSVAELRLDTADGLQQLLALGGFPEPFLGGSEVEARRWSRDYRSRLVREEIASLERIQDLGQIELLLQRLPDLVGSPLSINALREDLQVAHRTAATWLQVLERLFAIFRLSPFGAPAIRAVKKEQKHYHWDWTVVRDPATRFENLVASHLLKWVHYEQDARGRDLELRYFRDIDRREVDFVIVEHRTPRLFVECKWADAPIERGLRYLKARFPKCPAWQISARGLKDYASPEGIRVSPALALLSTLT
jgi:predicted AAA+ superfamily ATPase